MAANPVILRLFNGSANKAVWDHTSPDFIDNWKPEARDIFGDHVQVTYATSVTVRHVDGTEETYQFDDEDTGLLIVDGVFYGDFIVLGANA